ncbi:DsbA family oxidoreductase [Deinococcus wulumuqiensis]|uniref:DsbA family oxidoreductase n=1 Tax=Deinococcus wulumuqiensis TaxID=980427 RepID=UPI0024320AA3|nr:DsbA family protein [Deinococcus wulumuqiensis]
MTDLYFDFLCPYAWRGVEMAHALRGCGETFRLRHFSLVQGNHPDNNAPDTKGSGEVRWWLTDQPLGAEGGKGSMKYQRPSLNAFLAARAAYRQGEEKSWAFTLALFRLHHEDGRELDETAFQDAAEHAGLDLAGWQKDRQDEAALRRELREDLEASAALGVFGTPTFVLGSGDAAYFKFEKLTRDPHEAQNLWSLFTGTLHSEAQVATVRRPVPRKG